VTSRAIASLIKYVRDHAARLFGLDGKYDRLSEEIKSLSGANTVHIIMHRKTVLRTTQNISDLSNEFRIDL